MTGYICKGRYIIPEKKRDTCTCMFITWRDKYWKPTYCVVPGCWGIIHTPNLSIVQYPHVTNMHMYPMNLKWKFLKISWDSLEELSSWVHPCPIQNPYHIQRRMKGGYWRFSPQRNKQWEKATETLNTLISSFHNVRMDHNAPLYPLIVLFFYRLIVLFLYPLIVLFLYTLPSHCIVPNTFVERTINTWC